MAAAPPPAPPPPPPSIPVLPTPIPVLNSKALDEQARSTMATIPPAPPPPSIPLPPAPTKNLLHGGVGWTADPGSEGCEMGTNSMGMVGGQDDVDGDDPQMGRDNDGKLQQCNNMVSRVQVGEDELHTEKPHPKPRLKKSNNRKGDVSIGSKSVSPRLRSPMQVASSPGVNMLARSEASRRASSMARSAALKRAKMEGCPETSQQSPSCTMTSPIPYLPHISLSIEDLSPGTRMTHSEGAP